MAVVFEFEIDEDEDEEFVDVPVDDLIVTAVLAHMTYGEFDDAITAVEDIHELGPVQSEQFFDNFTGVILAASFHADSAIHAAIEDAIVKIKSGEIKPIEIDR